MSAVISSEEQLRRVRPGELITAARMNELIDAVNDLLTRVTDLEGEEDNRVVITDLAFAGTSRLGDPLEIRGRNFGFSRGTQQVRFDDRVITEFRAGSSDTQLLVRVPIFSPFPEEGRNVLLTVSNESSSARRTLSILPGDRPVSGTLVDVLWETVTPNPVVAGSTVRLGYRLHSRVGATRTFTINPVVSRSELNTGIQILNEHDVPLPTREIQLRNEEEKLFFIVLPAVPSALTSGTVFNVTVSAVSGGVTGSDSRAFTVGTSITPSDPAITLSPISFSAVDDAGIEVPGDGSYDAATKRIGLRAGAFGRMQLEATLSVAARYNVTLTPSGLSDGWTRTLDTGATIDIEENDLRNGPAQRPIRFNLQDTAAAPDSTVEVVVQRVGQTSDERVSFRLSRI